MTVAYVDSGAIFSSVGGGSNTVAFPAVTTAGNLLVLLTTAKASGVPPTPSGWTLAVTRMGTVGTVGAENEGNGCATAFYKEATGSEGGTSLGVDGTGADGFQAKILQFSKTGEAWSVATTSGVDETAGTAWAVTGDADPGFVSGDLALVLTAVNGSSGTFSSHGVSASGCAFGTVTEREDNGSANGSNSRMVIATTSVSTGSSTAAPTYTATASTSLTYSPAGATVFLRLRETSSSPTLTDVDTDETIVPGQTGVVATGTNLSSGASARWVDVNTNVLALTNYSAHATAPTFDVPSLATTLAAGVKFGSGTFEILS